MNLAFWPIPVSSRKGVEETVESFIPEVDIPKKNVEGRGQHVYVPGRYGIETGISTMGVSLETGHPGGLLVDPGAAGLDPMGVTCPTTG